MPGFVVSGYGSGVDSKVKPYYKYTWDIENLFVGLRRPTSGGRAAPSTALVLVKDASLPSWFFDKEEVLAGSVRYKFAKAIGWDDVKITWYDTEGLADIMNDWRNAIWTPDGGLAEADRYKTPSVIRRYAYDGTALRRWRLVNSWPSAVRTSELTYTETAVVHVDVTLTYDWAVEEPVVGTV